jgi:hypothetical protein
MMDAQKELYLLSQLESETVTQIEQQFHDLIMNGVDSLITELIKDKALELPRLQPIVNSKLLGGFFQIPGYMGGIHFRFKLDTNPIELIVMTSSRMDQSDQQKFYSAIIDSYGAFEPVNSFARTILIFKIGLLEPRGSFVK